MTAQNASHDFLIFKTVASLPDKSGKYRASYAAASDLHGRWSDKAAQEHVARGPNKMSFERVDRARWEEVQTGRLNGYADTSDANAPVTPDEWVSL